MSEALQKWPLSLGALILLAAACTLLMGAYTGGAVADGGTVTGTIRLAGPAPELTAHVVEDQAFVAICGATVPNEQVVAGAEGELANVVVWIDGITAGAPAEPSTARLDQIECRYTPRVSAVTRGTELTITSSDETLHNTHGTQGRRTVFNLALPTAGIEIPRRLNRPGVVDVACDAGHTWMAAWVHVFEHPYFAVTAEDGRFELPDVPAGAHTLRAWHESFGEQTIEIELTAGGTANWDVSFGDGS